MQHGHEGVELVPPEVQLPLVFNGVIARFRRTNTTHRSWVDERIANDRELECIGYDGGEIAPGRLQWGEEDKRGNIGPPIWREGEASFICYLIG